MNTADMIHWTGKVAEINYDPMDVGDLLCMAYSLPHTEIVGIMTLSHHQDLKLNAKYA